MRQIKFRAWSEEKMYYGHGIFTDQNDKVWLIVDDNIFPPQAYIKGKLMQFTGLLDENGKEIYEGDIVIFARPTDWNNNPAWEMTFFEGSFVGKREDKYYLFGNKEVKIIGNIYENPELLTAKTSNK